MLYNEKEKLWNKENKLFSWQTSRKVNSFLGEVETISPSSFPSRKRKNRGIPLWQLQQEITSFLLPDWNMKRFSSTPPLWKRWWLRCHVSQHCSFQVQPVASTALKSERICIFAPRSLLLQPPHAARSPKLRNSANFKSASHCVFFFQETSSKTSFSFRKIF